MISVCHNLSINYASSLKFIWKCNNEYFFGFELCVLRNNQFVSYHISNILLSRFIRYMQKHEILALVILQGIKKNKPYNIVQISNN